MPLSRGKKMHPNLLKRMIPLILVIVSQQSLACTFDGLQLVDLTNSPKFQYSAELKYPFPQKLFGSFEEKLGTFDTKDCQNNVVKQTIKDKGSNITYTAFYTNEDDCDGGNSYGAIVKGTEPNEKNVVALIMDSFLMCLE